MEDEDTAVTNKIIAVEEDAAHNTMGIGAEAVVAKSAVILHINVGHTECVTIRENTAGSRKTETIRMWCGTIRFQEVSKNAPDRSGKNLQVKLMYKKLKNLINMNDYVALL